jgi:hypothetical protein
MAIKRKPPEYRCIKLKLIKILNNTNTYKNQNVLETLNDAVIRCNKIVIKAYMLLRLWILKKYETNQNEVPILTTNIIRIAFIAVSSKSQGKKPKSDNLLLLNEFTDLFKNTISGKFEDSSKLSTILNYYSTTVLTSIENNIKNNFIKYINRYVNSFFHKKYEENISNKDFKKQLNKELGVLKKDLIENTSNCDDKYITWLNENRNKIVPSTDNLYKLLNDNPQSLYKYMIYINNELERLEKKQYQFFPLQSNNVLKHIQIDTGALIELFEKQVAEKKKNIEAIKDIIWIDIFNINYKVKGYVFDNAIITDGFSVSIRFVHNKHLEVVNKKKKAKKEGNKKKRQRLNGLTVEEKKIENAKIIQEKEDIKKEKTQLMKLQKENDKKNGIQPNTKTIKNIEFPYIDDVDKNELIGNHIFIDPGKRSLLTMVDDNNKYLKYTNSEYLSKTKRLKYCKCIEKYKADVGIKEIESQLSSFNSKSCKSNIFLNFITKKLEVNSQVLDKYNDKKFRKYKWYSFINKKRAEDKLLNKIENIYSKEHIIIMGDWSIGKQMANFISTPNIRIKRKLSERFKVFNIDEFRTSCLNYKTYEKVNNLWLIGDDNKYHKKHSILTFKMENKRLGCLDRDKNGCQNIKMLFNSYMTLGTIPEVFKRSYKIPEQ